MSEDLLSFKLLKDANLSSHHEQLIKATITHIDYETIKAKIKSIFLNEVQTPDVFEHEVKIKADPTYLTKESISEEDEEYENNDGESIDEPAEALYLQTRKRRPLQQYKHQSTRVRPPHQRQNYSHLPTSSIWKENLNPRTSQGKNPLKNGQPTRCNICQSINHWATQCPDRNLNEVAMIVHELVLQNSNDIVLQSLLSETWRSAVLDPGATSTVYSQVWFDEYFKSLPLEQQSKITYITSSKPFRFGDGRQLTSVKAASTPATIGSCKVEIKTDIIDSDI